MQRNGAMLTPALASNRGNQCRLMWIGGEHFGGGADKKLESQTNDTNTVGSERSNHGERICEAF